MKNHTYTYNELKGLGVCKKALRAFKRTFPRGATAKRIVAELHKNTNLRKKRKHEEWESCLLEQNIKMTRDFIKASANVNAQDTAALRYVSGHGLTGIVNLLLKAGAYVHADNDAPLRYASDRGHYNTVKLLLKHGAYVHALDNSAIRWASAYGHLKVIKLLVKHGANVHAKRNQALRWAKKAGHEEVVKYLESVMEK